MNNDDLLRLLEISLSAGREILEVYQQDFEVVKKVDDSPLTIADERSHHVIMDGLQKSFPKIPILSEEGRDISYQERKDWKQFWLVDPLDGTKEFVKKNDEFTVNIALIEGNYPVLGVIYAPVLDIFYYGKEGLGAFKIEKASKLTISNETELIENSISLPEADTDNTSIRVVASRSHMSDDTQAFINELKEKASKVEVVSAGSSLKFCLVAEGKADYYPRYAPTMEWDTGAGQAIVEAAGGSVTRQEDKERFYYNREVLKNGWFLAKIDKSN
ncbi:MULTISPECIES: 3'(2'),5'-bisphosphate nucleotidase CysQ [Paraliobacillus]|uniref:3'(2'),5'-bisphosphate nucleotidase CysQ n=1 Tax=Paraliobacillus TaxID=200903 RepID=UPI000DD333D5|nr:MULTISPECIES: 3'(2'),5'-bisphosphate nucleotidase CysQ [Paraliobacillus]